LARSAAPASIEDVAALDAIIAPALAPFDLLGLELAMLDRVARRAAAPLLIAYSLGNRLVSIGRYHLYGGPPERGGINVMRRLTGGRVVGAGEGWLGVALILPNRSALLPDRDAHLKPEQIMNRYARGILSALERCDLKCFYPGRDAITFDRRELAMCSFETDSQGAMLFEAALAINRGMEELVHDLERVDPDGQLPSAMYGPEIATKLVREIGHDISFEEVAGALVNGYRDQLGEVRVREFSSDEAAEGTHRGAALAESGWLTNRATDASLKLAARASGQLGAVEAHAALRDGRLERLVMSGDFIANSPVIAAFEREVCGGAFDLPSISRAVVKTFASGENYFLGLGDLSNLVQLVMKLA
jgi:lipoate-protein ligase A